MSSSLILEKPENFKHMVRVYNTNLDGKRKAPYALRAIRGIGRRFAHLLCKIAKVDPHMRGGELTDDQMTKITEIIEDPLGHGIPLWCLNRRREYKDNKKWQAVSNNLDIALREDVERLKKIKAHRGVRHHLGHKVRGQHTKSTGRHGVTLGVERKKKQN